MTPAKKRILYRLDRTEIRTIRAYSCALLYALNDKLPFQVRQAYKSDGDVRAVFYARFVEHEKDGVIVTNLRHFGNTESDPYRGTKPVGLRGHLALERSELDGAGEGMIEVAVGDHRSYVGSFLIFIRKAKEGEGLYKLGGPGLKTVEGYALEKIRRTNSYRDNLFETEESKEIVMSRNPERLGLEVFKREVRAEWGPMAAIAREKEKKKAAWDPTDSSFSPPKKKKSARPRDPTDS